MKQIEGFNKLGLSGRDSRVYVALLREGVSSIRTISDTTSINRGSVYESLKNLMAVGLVNFQQTNINKKYFAEDPTKIFDLIKQKRGELDEIEEATKQILPNLLSTSAYLPYSNIKFYEDHEGVAIILRDVLETISHQQNKEYYAISSKVMRQYLYKKFPSFTKQRIKQAIFVKVIAIGDGGEEAKVSARKWLPNNSETQPSSYTLIYGDKLAIIALNDNLNPYGLIIKDAGVAQAQKLIFEQLWQIM